MQENGERFARKKRGKGRETREKKTRSPLLKRLIRQNLFFLGEQSKSSAFFMACVPGRQGRMERSVKFNTSPYVNRKGTALLALAGGNRNSSDREARHETVSHLSTKHRSLGCGWWKRPRHVSTLPKIAQQQQHSQRFYAVQAKETVHVVDRFLEQIQNLIEI